MASYHCDALMVHRRTSLPSGHVVHEYTCPVCRHREREVRASGGQLLSWKNVSLVARQPSVE